MTLSVEFIYCGCGCQKTRSKYDKLGREMRYIAGHSSRGPRNRKWKDGIYNAVRYIYQLNRNHRFATNRGYVPQHRLIYEEYYKCSLLPWAAVHHLNGNKKDNRIENLEGMTKRQHKVLHSTKDMTNRKCSICGKSKTHYRKDRNMYEWYVDKNDSTKWWCLNCYNKIRKRSLKPIGSSQNS